MKRFLSVILGMAIIAMPSVGLLHADDDAASAKALAEKAKADPTDKAIDQYVRAVVQEIFASISQGKIDAANEQLAAFRETIESIEPTDSKARVLHSRAKRTVDALKTRIDAAAANLDDLYAALKKNPGDTKTFSMLRTKVIGDISSNARSNPDAAQKMLDGAKKAIAEIKERAEKESVQRQYDSLLSMLGRYQRSIDAGRKHQDLIGQPMAPLENIDAWVNAGPYTADDLKGKVILLDFWAVWCGPCIATFPHLRDWQEKYGEKGLVIIGLTSYYNYTWDSAKNRASRSREKVSHEDEQEMLKQFLAHHKLKHAIAVTLDRSNSEAYGVTGIPQVVVIDRSGKVRLIRVGSGEKNAHDVEEMIKNLIGGET